MLMKELVTKEIEERWQKMKLVHWLFVVVFVRAYVKMKQMANVNVAFELELVLMGQLFQSV